MKTRSFDDLVYKLRLKIKATSSIKKQVLSFIQLDNVDIHLRDGSFSSDLGIVNLHPSNEKNWVAYIRVNFFDCYGCLTPQKLSKFNMKRIWFCLFSEYKIQGLTHKWDSYCASFCL